MGVACVELWEWIVVAGFLCGIVILMARMSADEHVCGVFPSVG
jgi:hypothetical protein